MHYENWKGIDSEGTKLMGKEEEENARGERRRGMGEEKQNGRRNGI